MKYIGITEQAFAFLMERKMEMPHKFALDVEAAFNGFKEIEVEEEKKQLIKGGKK